jgi:hypothetical protein
VVGGLHTLFCLGVGTQVDKNEAIAILQSGFGRELLHAAGNYVAPIFWTQHPSLNVKAKINNGSIFFLDCGLYPLAVTAWHVYDRYLSKKQRDPSLICQIGCLPFDPEERLVDGDQRLDIATFRIEATEVARIGKWIYRHVQSKWPPPPPEHDKGVFFAGFPSIHHQIRPDQVVDWRIYSALLTTKVVKDREVICQFEREDFVDILGLGLPPRNQWLGGLSGAPLWTLTENHLFAWRLGGIIFQRLV